MRKNGQRGSVMVEFALAGVAGVTLLISTVQLSIAMWNYHTLAYATHETNRYISVHGLGCVTGGNSCGITVANIAAKFEALAIGIPSNSVSMTLTSDSGTTHTCNPLNTCDSDSTSWPPSAHFDNARGRNTAVAVTYTFHSAIVIIWAGGQSPDRIGSITLPSTSKITMQY